MYCNPSDPTAAVPGFPMIPPPGLLMSPQPLRSSKVSFHDTRMEVRVVSLACLSDELRADIWYTPTDIDAMRTEARDLCRYLRVHPQACPEEHTRGLELRISLERQCRKQLTVQGVVEAQRRSTDPAFLACLAQRCSLVPKEMALAQAQKDYCNVYSANAPTQQATTTNHQDASFPFAQAMNNYQLNPQLPQHLAPVVLPAAAAQEEICMEPIPLSAADQSLMFLQGNKRSILGVFDDNQERIVRRRLEGYQVA